jgi:hypothetical protein
VKENMPYSKKAIRNSEYAQCEGSESEKQDPSVTQKKNMPLLKCKCGTRILLIPDIKVMDKAIEKHLAEHRKTIKSKTNSNVIDDLRHFLTRQLFGLSNENESKACEESKKILVSYPSFLE